ncbi:hypothetical protein VU01_12863 [Candidatus Electrothrix marina]|uniref:Uncharacterized protein n=1 Tax=Candidatus Electrothrix marina TaxID=1859130 RepID=A0A444JCB3_9BACT|nr:hypothetical protein VU01_12863 [Candidatus Electrothrix marina]
MRVTGRGRGVDSRIIRTGYGLRLCRDEEQISRQKPHEKARCCYVLRSVFGEYRGNAR